MANTRLLDIKPGTRLRVFSSLPGVTDPHGVYLRRYGPRGIRAGVWSTPSIVMNNAACIIDRNVLAAYGGKAEKGAFFAFLDGELDRFGALTSQDAKRAVPVLFDRQDPTQAFKLVDGRIPIQGAERIYFARSNGRSTLLAVNPSPL